MDETDIIGGFPTAEPNCKGCGRQLTIDNAWMTDGCPCNHALGVNSMNETRWRLLMQLQQKQQHHIAYLENLDKLRQSAGITAAMLRDGRAKAMVERDSRDLWPDDLHEAWRHSVRAFNLCENSGQKDSATALAEIVVKLSQQLEFADTMNGEMHVPEGHHVVEDADGERLVKSD